jgi:hypothetical protein
MYTKVETMQDDPWKLFNKIPFQDLVNSNATKSTCDTCYEKLKTIECTLVVKINNVVFLIISKC